MKKIFEVSLQVHRSDYQILHVNITKQDRKKNNNWYF